MTVAVLFVALSAICPTGSEACFSANFMKLYQEEPAEFWSMAHHFAAGAKDCPKEHKLTAFLRLWNSHGVAEYGEFFHSQLESAVLRSPRCVLGAARRSQPATQREIARVISNPLFEDRDNLIASIRRAGRARDRQFLRLLQLYDRDGSSTPMPPGTTPT